MPMEPTAVRDEMRIKHNSALGGVILLVALVYVGAAGYIWYAHAEAKRIEEKRAANVVAAEKKIAIFEDEIKRLSADKEAVDAESKAIDPKIKAVSEKIEAGNAKLKEADDVLSYLYRKMDDSRQSVDRYNRELLLQSGNRNLPAMQSSGDSPSRKLLAEEEKNLRGWQTDLEKANCHYDCMGRENSDRRNKLSKSSDKGVWGNNRIGILCWKCKQHGYTFTQPIGYLDHKSEVSKILASLEQCQKRIDALKSASAKESQTNPVANQPGEQPKMATFDAEGWDKRIQEQRNSFKKLQEIVGDDRKILNKLNAEKLELDSMARDIKRQIVEQESLIRNQRLQIVDNQK